MHVLLIDDDEATYLLLQHLIEQIRPWDGQESYDIEWARTYREGKAAIAKANYDVYLLDYRLGGRSSGLDLLRDPVSQDCPAPIIMLTGMEDPDVDMSAMRLGAADFLIKDQVTLPLLERSIRYARESRQVRHHLHQLVQERTRDLVLLEQQAQQISALQKATSSLLSTLELPVLVGQILDAVQEAIPAADHARLCIADEARKQGRQLITAPLEDPRLERIDLHDLPEEVISQLMDEQTLLISEAQAEPQLLPLLASERDAATVGSAVIAPLISRHQLLGALSLTSVWPSTFSEATRKLLTSFAQTATAALRNAILYAEIRELAASDSITGQFNRRMFYELGQQEAERCARSGRPFSVVLIDVESFGEINRTHGYAVGDQVLKLIAQRASEQLHPIDILSRFGNDEFTILLPGADGHAAAQVAGRIEESIGAVPLETTAGALAVAVRTGVAEGNGHAFELGMLIEEADRARRQSQVTG